MRRAIGIFIFLIALFGVSTPKAHAIGLNLDSIATWGKFPRFCVNTYRWGDRFFNGYDTTYVVGTGYKFNAKAIVNSWSDGYLFSLPNDNQIMMVSDPSTSLGLTLTYMALTAGYDINVSKLFGGRAESRKRWQFGFNCMLFAAEFYYQHNTSTTTIRRYGPQEESIHTDIPFNGIDNESWGFEAYYFFNHKRYSEAASFNYSRIQKRSQGSFFLGFVYSSQKINFDFSEAPTEVLALLPTSWKGYNYGTNTNNYAVRIGYGYNWVFHPSWVLGISESPVIGLSKGVINSDYTKTSYSLSNRLKVSVVWNNNRWFAGFSGKFDLNVINNEKTVYAGADIVGEAVIGYRFNLW